MTVHRGGRVIACDNLGGFLEPEAVKEMAAWDHSGSFSLDASVRIESEDRPGLERLLRYCARPVAALERLRQMDPEHLVYESIKPGPGGSVSLLPVPSRAETTGRTEQYVGSWLKRQARDKVILATKATGPARSLSWIREGQLNFTGTNLRRALEGSLKRLQTDYVDLYQLHWPDRNMPMFGGYHFDPEQERETVPLRETLETLAEFIKEGKVRTWGPSNETPWGLMSFLRLADELGLPRPVSVQNAYSLLNRTWENGLAEIGYREKVSLLAYSPLGFGFLTGKYLKDPRSPGRANLFSDFAQRYKKPNTVKAVAAYVDL